MQGLDSRHTMRKQVFEDWTREEGISIWNTLQPPPLPTAGTQQASHSSSHKDLGGAKEEEAPSGPDGPPVREEGREHGGSGSDQEGGHLLQPPSCVPRGDQPEAPQEAGVQGEQLEQGGTPLLPPWLWRLHLGMAVKIRRALPARPGGSCFTGGGVPCPVLSSPSLAAPTVGKVPSCHHS